MSSELELDSELDNGKSDYYPVCVVLCLGCRAREPMGKAQFKGRQLCAGCSFYNWYYAKTNMIIQFDFLSISFIQNVNK